MTEEEFLKHEFEARQKAILARVEHMTDDEVWEWLESLPDNEGIAVLSACAGIQAREESG